MNLLRAGEFKVGLLVLAVASLIAYMSVKVSENPNFFAKGSTAYFMLPDAGGLVKGGQIKTAGIPVGTIANISLQDNQARVDLNLKPDVTLTVSAAIRLRSQGILGDKYVDIYPGSPTDPPIENGGQILIVQDKGSLDSVLTQVGDIAGSLKDVAKTLKEAVSEDGSRKHVLGRIILNVERMTQELADTTSHNRQKINEIVDQVHSVTTTLNEVINDPKDDGFKQRWATALERIDNSLKNIETITHKINNGEGTIGKLVSDEATAEKVEGAIDGLNELLGSAGSLQTGIDANVVYLGNIGAAKTSVGIRLQPGLDRYYFLGVVDDPTGAVEVEDRVITTDGTTVRRTEQITYRNQLKFNAWFAKNFYDVTVRAGVFENSGGIAFDYLYRDKMKISLEALEFSKLNLRAQLQYNLWKGIYLTAGAQDILNKGKKYSNYLGAGLLLTNDDLKLLMTKLPM